MNNHTHPGPEFPLLYWADSRSDPPQTGRFRFRRALGLAAFFTLSLSPFLAPALLFSQSIPAAGIGVAHPTSIIVRTATAFFITGRAAITWPSAIAASGTRAVLVKGTCAVAVAQRPSVVLAGVVSVTVVAPAVLAADAVQG
ncbi:hypothetical protein [Streptomyces hainanensis]|uniref:Uncharacterized protein n=1 Tax=Streptomyces hainanensis TaxID=402648 RepID=A0A4R4THU4_9ACTN|nr:hypothetical protein [Streptomyces hainanensis]TDC77261.1 hypothetical protein E1283_07715 [Streptomyces hainanensis]